MKRYIPTSLITSLLLAAGFAQAQNVQPEVETSASYQDISSAQQLNISSGTAIVKPAALGNVVGAVDTDYFYFYGTAGDKITAYISGTITGTDTIMALYQAIGGYPLLDQNDDAASPSPGSTNASDSRIDGYTLPADGNYIIAVSNYPRVFLDGGSTIYPDQTQGQGVYTLTITGATDNRVSTSAASTTTATTVDTTSTAATTTTVDSTSTPAATPVDTTSTATAAPTTSTLTTTTSTASTTTAAPLTFVMQVKPGSRDHAVVNPAAHGRVQVALLSSATFNALDVNVSTLTFGSQGNETSLTQCSSRDVNRDGRMDLVCFVDFQKTNFKRTDSVGIARGMTKSGRAIEGRGYLKVIPAKRGR